MAPTKAQLRDEVEALHVFFVGWFTGALPKSAFDTEFLARLAPGFVLIPPGGELLTRAALATGLHAAHGSNPDFRIAIRAVEIRHTLADHVLVTYEEWQRNAPASTPADNGRLSTALLRHGERLEWLHVHETWLPPAVMAAGPYDF